jgi:hypothetical protein
MDQDCLFLKKKRRPEGFRKYVGYLKVEGFVDPDGLVRSLREGKL